jgi:branched-chain amino acid transport system permease protein
MTLAIDQILLGLTQMVWGSVEIPLQLFNGLKDLGIPSPMRIESEWLGGRVIVRTELVVAFIMALVAFGAFVAFFRYTNVGLAMRATAENQQLAQSVGLRVRLILAVAWGIASLLAATAGVLQGGATSLSLNMRFLALQAFPAVLLGGLESIEGALVGGIIIGLVQEWGNLLLPNAQIGTELAPYVVLMIVLVIRPDGLFGEKRIERI